MWKRLVLSPRPSHQFQPLGRSGGPNFGPLSRDGPRGEAPTYAPARSGGNRGGRVIYLHPNPTAHLVGAGGSSIVASHSSGRHRAPGRFNPVSELSGIVASAAQPAVKTSAVIAASGGLVASFALPASAATASPTSVAKATTVAAPVAVQAPETAAPAATNAFGVIGFKATARPSRSPSSAPAARDQADRSSVCDRQPLDGPRLHQPEAGCGWRPRHRGPVRRPDVLLRRHQPVDRLRLLRLHALRLPPGRHQPAAHGRGSSARPPPACPARSPGTSCSSAARPTTWASTPGTA